GHSALTQFTTLHAPTVSNCWFEWTVVRQRFRIGLTGRVASEMLNARGCPPPHHVNLRFIEAFVWVARLRSFRAASQKLHATQTTISARIASLESDFGVRLFERDKRTVTLTRAGEELLQYAEQLLGISTTAMPRDLSAEFSCTMRSWRGHCASGISSKH